MSSGEAEEGGARRWVRACALAELPRGTGCLVELEGEAVALFRLGDEVYALDNACPHRGAPLAHGEVRGSTVYCPVHAWAFDVRSGACEEAGGARHRTYPVRVEGGAVLVGL